MEIVITIVAGIIAVILFILAEHKEEVWSKIEFKDDN